MGDSIMHRFGHLDRMPRRAWRAITTLLCQETCKKARGDPRASYVTRMDRNNIVVRGVKLGLLTGWLIAAASESCYSRFVMYEGGS